MYLLYNLVIWLGSLFLVPWLAYRTFRGRLPGVKQRLGFLPEPLPDGSGAVAWFHAVSLGEVKIAAALADEVRSRVPGVRMIFTSSTRTGWEEARRRVAPADTVLFPPLDLGWVCRHFLRQLKPNVVLVMETELWPNLFRETKRFGASLLLLNGRISDRSFPRYQMTRALWQQVLSYPDALFVQSPRDADRFFALGAPKANVRLTGNLKFMARPTSSSLAEALRRKLPQSGAAPVLVAGSTMPGEEKYLLNAFLQLRQEFPRLWMVLAPRHPERFDAVAEQVRNLGIPLQRRSQWQADTNAVLSGVLLLDTTGELGPLYQLASVAFVGGTLVSTGGHNILEPAHFARPTVIGPSMHNFREIVEEFLNSGNTTQIPGPGIHTGAVVQVQDGAALVAALRYLFSHPEFARRLGESARELLDQHLIAVQPVIQELEQLLTKKPPPDQNEAVVPQRSTVEAGKLHPLVK